MLGYLRFCDESVPGGLPALWAGTRDAGVEAFFAQSFLAGGWYDVLPLETLARAAALRSGIPHLEFLRRHAQRQAEQDIHGIYRVMLKLATPERVLQALPRTAQRYFDFVRSEVRELERSRWVVTIHGVPAPVVLLYRAATEAFIVRALEIAGARELRHRWLRQEPSGALHGVPILTLEREIAWSK